MVAICSAEKFRIKGISWFGMEEKYAILQGLEVVSMGSLLDLIERNGFNTIRVPLSVTSTLHDPKANMFGGGVVQENPQLNGLRYHEVVDVLVRDAGRRHLLILLDMHRLSAGDRNNALWWDATVSEQQLIDAWLKLAARHCSSWNVIGADLFNEPWGAAWGHGPVNQDWAAAAERIGAAVSKACPRWLLFVEGVSHTTSNDEPAVRGQSTAATCGQVISRGRITPPPALQTRQNSFTRRMSTGPVCAAALLQREGSRASWAHMGDALWVRCLLRKGMRRRGWGAGSRIRRGVAAGLLSAPGKHHIGSFYWVSTRPAAIPAGLFLPIGRHQTR